MVSIRSPSAGVRKRTAMINSLALISFIPFAIPAAIGATIGTNNDSAEDRRESRWATLKRAGTFRER
jgi:hypothetical protein